MTIFNVDTLEVAAPEIDEITGLDVVARVILYNDDVHTIDEVANQIMRATGYSESKAMDLTMEVHLRGKATIYDGPMTNCLRVSAVLEEIALLTEVVF